MPPHVPAVDIEEFHFPSAPIQGLPTGNTGFVSPAGRGPLLGPLGSFVEFEQVAPPNLGVNLPLAARGFFENGGQTLYISRIDAGDPLESGLAALDALPISILCCPDEPNIPNAPAALAAHCEKRKDRMCILQSPQPVIPVATHRPPVNSTFAAYYYPWITVPPLAGAAPVTIPPGGHIAGIYAQTGTDFGVWVAPDDKQILGVTGLSQNVTPADANLLSALGIDLLRFFPTRGNRIWGARTTSTENTGWKYVNVRRLLIYIEQSISQGIQWTVFQPDGPPLWAAVSSAIGNFLATLWRSGALKGATAQEAYFVRCDRSTMTQTDIDNGRLICVIGVAAVQPAEFVIFQITVLTQ